CHPATQTLLKWLDAWKEPARLPKAGLLLESDDACRGDRPRRKRGLSVIRGACFRALRQLLELATEDIVEAQATGDLACDGEVLRPLGIEVDLLQQDEVSIRLLKELDDAVELEAAVDIPVDNSDGTPRPHQ